VRWLVLIGAAVALLAACGQSPDPRPAPSSSKAAAGTTHINLANIERVGGELPAGYEVGTVEGSASPAGFWGFGSGWAADPPHCAGLVDPVGATAGFAKGVSGSGAGGIVYAVVVTSPSGPVALDPAVVADCGHWTMAHGSATASVDLIDAPPIDGVATLGMVSATRTLVEGGSEIASQEHTFAAYLGDHYAFVTLITDPGSPYPPLQPGFAADLLVKTVSALRG